MKITILAYGSLGDVQPYVALGAGLQRSGHDVTIAADPYFDAVVRAQGLTLAPVSGNPLEVFESEAGQTVADSEAGLLARFKAYGTFNREMKSHIEKNLVDSWDACRSAEVLIFSFNAFGGYHIAEKLGVPAFAVAIAPFTRTRTMPSINFAPRPNLGSRYNLLTHTLTERLFFMPPSSHAINQWRTTTLAVPALPKSGFMRRLVETDAIPVLYSFSPELLPPPADWPAWVHVTGYWFPERDPQWQPDPSLVDFLAAGPPPVYIGFGSMSTKAGGRSPRARVDLIVDALAQAGQRGIVSFGTDMPADVTLPSTVYAAGAVPHDWLFPQVALTVHHGGSGTTAQSLRAGVPMVVTPFMWDQPFWARRAHALGVAPAPVSNKRLTAAVLGRAIQETAGNLAMRERAQTIGERVRRESGVERATSIINERLRG